MDYWVNLEYVEALKPCKSGFDNLKSNYPNLDIKLSEFLKLDNIPYNDKIWLVTKSLDIKTLNQWSVECAENVLDNFEKVYPNDSRVKDCIKITKSFLLGECPLKELKYAESAAWSAAWSAESAESAESAARSAAWSAESAESAARSAAWSAAWSAESAESAESAAWSAESAESAAKIDQETINLSILIALIQNEA